MKKIILGAALTGVAVTAGIFGLQEYRKYEFRSAIADAREAAWEQHLDEYQAEQSRVSECLSPMYDDLIANNINGESHIKQVALAACGWIDDYAHVRANSELKVIHNFEIIPRKDFPFPSDEWDRQNEWVASYISSGFSTES